MRSARLEDLVSAIGVERIIGDPGGVEIASVVADSRECTPGSLFCCVHGSRTDGHELAVQAVAAGAVALVCERPVKADAVQVLVGAGAVRPAMAHIAAEFWGRPAERMTTAAVTGTNGKTTVTHLLGAIFGAAGLNATVIGTLSGTLTTPESTELQALLARAADSGVRAAAMEVSSHGMHQHRVDGIVFDVAAFTNLGHDHLDFHGTQEFYFEAKARLFDPEHSKIAVVNVDDPWGERLMRGCVGEVRGYSRRDADGLVSDGYGSRFAFHGQEITLHLPGGFNVDNALAAASCAEALGIDGSAIVRGIGSVARIPGRLERVPSAGGPDVFVDYAHTPDALTAALEAARSIAKGDVGPGRVIVVFGCGGDRDASKRPLMGKVAGDMADVAIVTTDNPRGEDPRAIISDILSGSSRLHVVGERDEAIRRAISTGGRGDVVLIAGKGHENTQTVGDTETGFDDRVVAARVIDELGLGRGAS